MVHSDGRPRHPWTFRPPGSCRHRRLLDPCAVRQHTIGRLLERDQTEGRDGAVLGRSGCTDALGEVWLHAHDQRDTAALGYGDTGHVFTVKPLASPNADKKSRGQPPRQAKPASVEQTRRVLMYLRMFEGVQMSLLARAEAIGLIYEKAGAPQLAPVRAIDRDPRKLPGVRENARAVLRDRLHREPTVAELAVEVAKRYPRGDLDRCEAAVKTLERLVHDARRFEYALPGLESITGRLPLPST